jgi:hypothetical protein
MNSRPRRQFVITGIVWRHTTRDGNYFVTCRLDGDDGHLAIWGTPGGDMTHVEAFDERAKQGFPVTVDCEWIRPTGEYWEQEHGHRYWAYERHAFRVLP